MDPLDLLVSTIVDKLSASLSTFLVGAPQGRRTGGLQGAGETHTVRIAIHVRPRSARARVGGTHDGLLVIHVVEPATEGRATDAAIAALARALGITRSALRLTHGATSRRKIIEVDLGRASVDESALEARVDALRDEGAVSGD
jgi:uncharacterized protein